MTCSSIKWLASESLIGATTVIARTVRFQRSEPPRKEDIAKEQQLPCSMVLAGSVVPVRRRSIPCFVSAAFARQLSNGITKALTIRLFFWSGKFPLAATEKNSLIRTENREFAT
jgi:hypothetical protein